LKTRNYILIILAFGIWNNSFSQKTELEKYYVRVDTSFISILKKAYEASTEELMKTLEVKNDDRENLGFGYELKISGKGLGSTSIDYKILYYKNEIISYEITTQIPNKSRKLKKLYKEKISSLFKVDDDYNVLPIYFGIDKANEPLVGIDKKANDNLNEIMNPFIGIVYGDYCGIGMNLLESRKRFEKIIKVENCEYLLYSKNPGIRLMAVKFYYCNLNKFSESQVKLIETRIENLKRKPILTKTCSGCIISGEITKKLITELKNCR
jgi:hypothetical protein